MQYLITILCNIHIDIENDFKMLNNQSIKIIISSVDFNEFDKICIFSSTRFRKSGVEGVIKCKNGRKTKTGSSQYKKDSCYILQDDHLIAYFTVYEIMYSTTQLKISGQSKEKTDFLVGISW